MIDLYSTATPNGHKVHIMLEECGFSYCPHHIDIGAGDQFSPDFLRISPNNKIPAIVDNDGPDGKAISLFESGAILFYLATKANKFIGTTERDKFNTMQWLMFQMGGVGPMLGQAHHFRVYAPEKVEYAIKRYTNEAKRLYSVIDRRLENSPYLAGEHYTIADMATFPWLRSWEKQGIVLSDFPHLLRWFNDIAARPAVQKGTQLFVEERNTELNDKAREILYGATQYAKR